MKLFVVRHGETNYNVNRAVSFATDTRCHLTEKGMQQAYAAKKELEQKEWDIVIISEMYRTEQTAAILNEEKQKFIFIDPRINEITTGIEGENYDVYKYLQQENASSKNAESFNQVYARVKEFLEELKKKKYDSVLIVTHLIVMKIIRKILENLSEEQTANYRPDNAEIYEAKL